jgi:3-deoxy-D-manno-octulosonate 8-phosphate phosphatase (KDO 8-P phosphatase)
LWGVCFLISYLTFEMEKNFKELLGQITTFVFDVDGVLTNGQVTLLPDGNQVRTMNIKDGYALQLAVKKGYRIAIISGGKSEMVKKRLNGLGIVDVYMDAQNKIEAFNDFIHSYDIHPDHILYMGDDMPDFEVMQKVAVPTCPFDAVSDIKSISIYISDKKGGEGCVRDVIEQVLRLKKNWE